jgi:hypothetical protein
MRLRSASLFMTAIFYVLTAYLAWPVMASATSVPTSTATTVSGRIMAHAPATACPDGRQLDNFFQTPIGKKVFDKRVADGNYGSAGNYGAAWLRITDMDDITIRRLRSTLLAQLLSGRDLKALSKSYITWTVRAAADIAQSEPELFEWLMACGMKAEDVVLELVGRSQPRQRHTENLMVKRLSEIEYIINALKQGLSYRQIKKNLEAKARVDITTSRLLSGASERQSCYACSRYGAHFNYGIPYGTADEIANAAEELDNLIQEERGRRAHEQQKQKSTGLVDSEGEQTAPFGQGVVSGGDCPGKCLPAGTPNGLIDALSDPVNAPGGIDFTSLELRYLGETDTRNGGRIQYAFRAPTTVGRGRSSATVGVDRVLQASDAFFTWLALPEDRFWVNLNPNEPDRIIDATFGRTDAGRVLLEADLELKKTVAKLIHPDTKLGRRFWDNLRSNCFSSRQWIVPAPATVRATNGELYILDAPLSVLMETEYVQDRGTGEHRSCRHLPKQVEEHNEKVYERLIIPRVEKAVNKAPEYAALRRVYLSRVAAEWYRNRSGEVPSAFSDLIDSGDIQRWELAGSGKPTDTFRAYVRSFTKGEFKVSRKIEGASYRTYTFGGVDFSRILYRPLSAAEFTRSWPGLTDAVKTGLHEAATDPKTQDTWLGGTSIADPEPARAGGGGAPHATRSAGEDGPGYVVPALLGTGVFLMLIAVAYAMRKSRTSKEGT